MIAMGKTTFGDFCNDTFKVNLKAIDVSENKYYLARRWIKEGHTVSQNEECETKLDKFIEYLKSKNLKITHFNFAFNKRLEKYVYQYNVRSKIHSNADLQIDGVIEDNTMPFTFFPNMFSSYFLTILNEAPIRLLEQVSKGG